MADFNYFDQYSDIEIDLTSFLKSMPVSSVNYTLNNVQPVKATIKNLFTKFQIVMDYKNNLNFILNYKVEDDEFMENVSYKVYGSTDYWWIVAVFNDVKEPFKDWPLTQNQLISIATKLYEQERKYSFSTYLDFMSANNEIKRDIILPKNDVVKDIIWKYRQAILSES